VKKYELPPQPKAEGGDLVSQSLKYMGLGGRAQQAEKTEKAGEASGESSTANAKTSTLAKVTSMPWVSGAFSRTPGGAAGESNTPTTRPRKKSIVEEREEEDDRNIRFTISGVNQRMTKDDFIKEMQKFDRPTRREIVDQSNASHVVKTLAKQDPQSTDSQSQSAQRTGGRSVTSPSKATGAGSSSAEQADGDSEESNLSDLPQEESPEISRTPSPGTIEDAENMSKAPSRMAPESAAERRRRLAVLKDIDTGDDGEEEAGETPAERRRREAALGMSSTAAVEDDSDDDDTPRVPPARRGIRFADAPERGG
jgi:predicted lactoylglutathione lyase